MFMVALLVVWPPLLFLGIAMVTGWRRLAREHPRVAPGPGARRTHGSAAMGPLALGYNGCVIFIADDDHLHIGLVAPFGWMFHPMMSIPWAAVEFVDGGRRVGVMRRVRLRIGATRVWVPAKVVERELAVRAEIEGVE